MSGPSSDSRQRGPLQNKHPAAEQESDLKALKAPGPARLEGLRAAIANRPSGVEPEVKKEAQSEITHETKKGDSLSKIAKELLGDANRWKEIYNLNKDQIADPDKIAVGMQLKIPGQVSPPVEPLPERDQKVLSGFVRLAAEKYAELAREKDIVERNTYPGQPEAERLLRTNPYREKYIEVTRTLRETLAKSGLTDEEQVKVMEDAKKMGAEFAKKPAEVRELTPQAVQELAQGVGNFFTEGWALIKRG